MSFLMYAPKGRRDYLSVDLSINDEFEIEAECAEMFDTRSKKPILTERQSSILGNAERRTFTSSVLIEGTGVNMSERGGSTFKENCLTDM